MILKEYWNTDKVDRRKNREKVSYFYIILIHIGRKRYIKIGTTSQTPHQRFKQYKANNYVVDKVVYICECTECEEYKLERYCHRNWNNIKGLCRIPLDRFSYFQIPKDFESIINNLVALYRN